MQGQPGVQLEKKNNTSGKRVGKFESKEPRFNNEFEDLDSDVNSIRTSEMEDMDKSELIKKRKELFVIQDVIIRY